MAKTEQELAAPQIVGPHDLLDDVTNDPLAGRGYMGYDIVPALDEGENVYKTASFGYPHYETGEFEVEFYHVLGSPYAAYLQFRTAGTWDNAALYVSLDYYDEESGIGSYIFQWGSAYLFSVEIPSASFDDANTNDNRVRVKGTWGRPRIYDLGIGWRDEPYDGIWFKYWFPATESEPDWLASGGYTVVEDPEYVWGPDYPPSLEYRYTDLWSTTIYPERQPGGFSMINVYSDDTEWKMKDRFTMDAVVWQPSWTTDAVIKKTVIGQTRPIPPEIISWNTRSGRFSTHQTCYRPLSMEDGDLLVAFVVGDENGESKTITSSGWTQEQYHADPNHIYAVWMFTKTVDHEPPSWDWTWGDGYQGSMTISVLCIRSAEVVGYASKIDIQDWYYTSETPTDMAVAKGLAIAVFGGNSYSSNDVTMPAELTELTDISIAWASQAVGYAVIENLTDTVTYIAELTEASTNNAAVLNVAGALKDGFSMDAIIVTSGMSIRSFTINAEIYYYEEGGGG